MKDNILESSVVCAVVALSILLLNPFHFWMPDMMLMALLATLLILLALFAGFVLRERSGDEREAVHRALAGRNAYLIGATLLIAGVIVEGYSHRIDPWLLIALAGMLVAKLATRVWSDRNL